MTGRVGAGYTASGCTGAASAMKRGTHPNIWTPQWRRTGRAPVPPMARYTTLPNHTHPTEGAVENESPEPPTTPA